MFAQLFKWDERREWWENLLTGVVVFGFFMALYAIGEIFDKKKPTDEQPAKPDEPKPPADA